MSNSYKFLSISSILFKVFSVAALILGIVSSVVIFIGGGSPDAPKATGFLGIALGIIYAFLFYVASEIIKILIDIAQKVGSKSTNV